VKLEDDDPPPCIDFVSILGLPSWRERLSLPEHSVLGSVDILPLPATLSHAKGGCHWGVGLEVSSSGGMSFAVGSDRFVQDSGLSQGNILRFRYLGGGHFSVYVWSNLWCRAIMPSDLM
jgi:hypothetical protein